MVPILRPCACPCGGTAEEHVRHPHETALFVRAVPDTATAGDLELPLRQRSARNDAGGEIAAELLLPLRIVERRV